MRLHTLIRDYQSQRLDPSHRRYGPSHGALVHRRQDFGIICVWFWGLRPRADRGFHAGPISRKSALPCPLRKYAVLSTNNKTAKTVISLHILQSTASVFAPQRSEGADEMSSVEFLAVEFALSHRIQHGFRNIAAQPSPTQSMRRKRSENSFAAFSLHGGSTASRHASSSSSCHWFRTYPQPPFKHSRLSEAVAWFRHARLAR